MEYNAAATIQASPETVWALLTNAADYPNWNPTVVRVEGDIALGQRIKVVATISPERTFSLKVTELVPQQRMVWESGLPLGLFRGVRIFTLQASAQGTQFSMREVFSGPLMGLMRHATPNLQPSFDEFARSLKLRAEG